MGLFAVDFGETKKEAIESLVANAKIWLEYAEKGENLDYLFTFMQQCLDDAKQREYLCKVTVSDKVKKNVHK